MDTDDIAPPPKPKPALPDLEKMSVEELHAHIASLEAEILRARAAIAAKQDARGVADSFFRS